MKNEDRIVELLAESLKKLDQHSELLGKIVDTLVKFRNNFNEQLKSVDKKLDLQYGVLYKIDGKVDVVQEHERRITRLEEKVFRNK